MEKTSFALLEFDKLLTGISLYAKSQASAQSVRELQPLLTTAEIKERQGLISEIMRMSQEGDPLMVSPFPDISPLLSKVRPEGAVLEGTELAGFIPVLSVCMDIAGQTATVGNIPLLEAFTEGLTGFPEVMRVLKRSVDTEGNILDSASPFLADFREKIRRLDTKIRKRLEEMVRDEKTSVFLQDDFITKRSGRWVIPVRMDSKGQVAGVVHDISKSGETAFVEPLAIIGPANELENLIAEEKAEEIRILRALSAELRLNADGIEAEYHRLVTLDTLNSIARFSLEYSMEVPSINLTGEIELISARHPLLMIALRKTKERDVVPLDLRLGSRETVMVITGSNAGGKTIAIKTVGLLLLMALTGMPVPASSSSSFPLLRNLLVDIGDEQSIESSLSTFSAHVSNISRILKTASPEILVLIDELGTGTDPEEGAALACAVLKELRERGGLVFATTHLSEIKGFVHRTEGMLNASMEFDRDKLTPLYTLRVGEPGQSHALETARRYGLPDRIVESAKAMLGGVKVEFDNLIADLNAKRRAYEDAAKELETLRADLEQRERIAQQRLDDAEEMKRKVLSEAYQEASDLLLATKRKMNAFLDEIKKTEAAKSRAVKEMSRKIAEEQKKVSEKLASFEEGDGGGPSPEEIREGGTVYVKSLGRDAEVIKVNRKLGRAKVRSGNIEVELPFSGLALKKGAAPNAEAGASPVAPDEMPSARLNLVGSRVDEALSALEPFLNHAALAGLSEVVVIHGIGAGILSKAVREHLDRHPLIESFRKGEKNEGGAGVTVIRLK